VSKRKNLPPKVFYNVSVIDTADEGLAIGRCEDGRIIMVRHVVPGDIADVQVFQKKKGMLIAKPIAIAQHSPHRAIPFCSHFGVCGGCKWQHMMYEAQLAFKEKNVHDAYRRIGDLDTAVINPIVGAADTRYYRNKLEYTASDSRWLNEQEWSQRETIPDQDGVGFHLPGAFDKVLDIAHCYLQPEPSNAIRLFVKSFCLEQRWPFFNLRSKQGFLRNLIIRNTQSGDVMVVIVVGQAEQAWIKALTDALPEKFTAIKSIYSCINTKVNDSIHDLEARLEYGAPTIIETLGHVRFHIGPKSFFQTNTQQAFQLYTLAKEMASLKQQDNIYDLYCGVGSLGLFMADRCAAVTGIEHIPEAIADAEENARLNTITNARFVTGKVELMLDPAFIKQYGHPDVIITDPPRAGMHPDAVRVLNSTGAEKIVYVSCNPATQARDIRLLADNYSLVQAVPVDMFPHTHHIECIALLMRK
jgi:23S rRNA (uracil1939-C5)-methyltransferase